MFSILTKTQKIIFSSLIFTNIIVVSMLGWIKLELSSVENNLTIAKANNTLLNSNLRKAIDANKKCELTLKQQLVDAETKERAILEYRKNMKKRGNNEKFNDINDFIDYAKRLR